MTEENVKMPDAHITDEMLAEMRQKTGISLRFEHSINNEEATRLSIVKFADGIGDTNPLWNDMEYAKNTKYRTIVAPPSWIFSVLSGVQFGFRGLGGFHNSTEVEFYKPVLLGDKITPECVYTGFEGPKASSYAESLVITWLENKYVNQRNDLVSKLRFSVIHIDRAKARERGKSKKIKLPHPWTEAELKKIEEEVLSEQPNGANTPCWDDVQIGQEIPTVTKGPLGLTDEMAFLVGGGAPIPRVAANRAALVKYQQHPSWKFRDPYYHAWEPIYAVHYNKAAANAMGAPVPYDVGFQRQCWQIHLICNWMGNDGWLKKCQGEYRKFVYFSDVVRFSGKITEKFVDNGEYCVKIETKAINQRGDNVMLGYAVVALPSKKHKTSPLDTRLTK